jgi:hypothetical protein
MAKEEEVAMKGKLFTLTLLMLVCAATANSQAPAPVLPKTVTGVNATSNVTVNVSMDRGFVLSGTITGDPASTADSVVAVSTTAGSFGATITEATHRYRIELPAGTYNLHVSFVRTSGQATTSFSYTDSTPVTVSADTDRNIALPAVSTFGVTGKVSNLLMLALSKSVDFDSTTVPGFSDVATSTSLDPSGNYSVQLPNGMFSVELSQQILSAASFITALTTALGSAVVSGTTTANFTAPTINTADLSGTVNFTGSSIPANAILRATDITGPPPPQTTSAGSGLLPTTGMYDFLLGTGDKYLVNPTVQVQLLPSPAPLGIFSPPDPNPSPNPLTGNTIRNITYPMLPGPAMGFTISGRVTTTGSGAPLPNVSVTAGSTVLSVAPNTLFGQTTTTDANGNYSMLVAAGTYSMFFGAGPAAVGDIDGDGVADSAVWRPSNGTWYVIPSKTPSNFLVQQWGVSTDIPVRGDFDGDGKTDFAVWRPSNGTWYVIPSKTPSNFLVQQWGESTDIPVPGDYDGDGKTDFAVWRPSNGTWYIIPSSNPSALIVQQWGVNGDIPVPGDYDGDGKTDFAVWRPSNGTWYVIPSKTPSNFLVQQWGVSGDKPVPGDYDGDGKTDFAVWRPSNGTWYVIPTSNPSNFVVQQWGVSTDIPVPADYDGDQIADFAVWRPSNGTWYVIPSSTPSSFAVTQWGVSTDVPVQKPIGQ